MAKIIAEATIETRRSGYIILVKELGKMTKYFEQMITLILR
jgi:hypothetical protein